MTIARALAAATMLAVLTGQGGPVAAQAPAAGGELDPRIQTLIASISEERLQGLLTRLASFHTRNTLSDPNAPNGLGAARQWILDEMTKASPRLQVSFDTHLVPAGGRIPQETELRNVIAVLPGRSPRRIYISGHYDSLNLRQRQDPNATAPGANDDGSGTVLSMELARIFAGSGIEFEATLVFMAVAGEEQGLVGSTRHAMRMKEQNVPVQALFNNDIVGGSRGGNGIVDGATIRLYSEGPEDSPSRSLANFAKRIAEKYVPAHEIRLLARRDRFGRGGDHSGFNAAGFAAIGFRESRENYSKQHNADDTLDGIDYRYLAQNARVNAAGMAVLALAPPPPAVRQNGLSRGASGYDARLRWEASPGAAGYRVFWRKAWGPDWEHELYVGNVTEFVLPGKNIDDHVFGVAAVGHGGHESTVSAYVMAPRND